MNIEVKASFPESITNGWLSKIHAHPSKWVYKGALIFEIETIALHLLKY